MKNKTLILILAAIFIFSLAGCAKTSKNAADATKPRELKTVKLGFPGSANFIGGVAGIAQEKKFIDEELGKAGYKIEYVPFAAAGPAVNEALAGKKIDLAIYADFPGLVLKSKDIGITLIGITDKYFNSTTIVKSDSPIKSVKELKGKKIAFTKGTYMQKYFLEVLALNGLSEKDMEIINVVTTDAVSALLNGNVDALIYTDNTVIPLIVNKSAREIDSTRHYPELSAQIIFVGVDSFLKENPDVPVAVIKALAKAKEFVKSNTQEAFQIWTKSGLNEEGLKIYYGTDGSKFDSLFPLKIDQESIAKLTATKKFMLDQKLISNDFDIAKFVDYSYYDKALK